MITLTDTASLKVKELIAAEGEDGLMLRVAVRPGGCSGFSYEMFFDTDVADDDVTVDYGGVHGRGRPLERPAARRRHARLQGRSPGGRVRHQQPERPAHLRLRPVLQLIARRCGGDATEIIPTAASGRPSSRHAPFVPLWLTWSGHA